MIIVLVGAPGSGKGTQGRRLSDHYRIPYMASGDLLRRAIEQHSALGEHVRQYVERGLYVPDELMVPAALAELASLRREWNTNGVVLDGFPRTREQAEALDRALDGQPVRVEQALFLAVPKDILVWRLSGRWVCRSCGASYNVNSMLPSRSGTCNRCSGELVRRVDDQAETVERRLTLYLDQTVPMLAYYKQNGRLVEVDGNRPESEVTAAIFTAIEPGLVQAAAIASPVPAPASHTTVSLSTRP